MFVFILVTDIQQLLCVYRDNMMAELTYLDNKITELSIFITLKSMSMTQLQHRPLYHTSL